MLGGLVGEGLTWVQALYSCHPQNCSQLIQTIEDTGTIMREVRDLEEQVRGLEMGGELKQVRGQLLDFHGERLWDHTAYCWRLSLVTWYLSLEQTGGIL